VPDRFLLLFAYPGDLRERTIELANETTEIHSAELVESLVVITGSIATTAGLVTILDAATGKERVAFLCWGPELSSEVRNKQSTTLTRSGSVKRG
jgi:hypothetical protein